MRRRWGHHETMHPMKWPLWLRAQIVGLLWGASMYAFTAAGPHTVPRVLLHLGGGVIFGLVLWAVIRGQERHLFGDLTVDERRAAVQAVRAARVPGDPRLREAATRLAWRWVRPRMRPVHQLVFFAFLVLLSIYLGIFVTRWGWLGVVFWPVMAWLSVRTEGGQQRAGVRYLRTAEAAGGTSVS